MPRRNFSNTAECAAQMREAYERTGSYARAARELRVSPESVRRMLIEYGQTGTETINLYQESRGECMRLLSAGPCEFASCRYRTTETKECVLAVISRGEVGLMNAAKHEGISKQNADNTVVRALLKLRGSNRLQRIVWEQRD